MAKSLEALAAARSRSAQPNWFHFIALSGREGREWVQEYRQPEHLKLTEEISRALELLRKRQIDVAGDLLRKSEVSLAKIAPSCESVLLVLERIYYPVLAYYHYCIDDFEAAEDALAAAGNALRRGVMLNRFLTPLVDSFIDFTFQRARIARNRRRWGEIQHHLESVRGMIEDKLPFCRLCDGTAIGLTALRSFYRAIPLTEEDRASVSYVLDDGVLQSVFETTATDIYCQIGLLIPYP